MTELSEDHACDGLDRHRVARHARPSHALAHNYGTEWLIYLGNNDLLRPAEALESAEIILGPLYKVLPHESINSIAARMSLDTSELLSWNPDLQSAFNCNTNRDVVLDISQEICVLPSTCAQ